MVHSAPAPTSSTAAAAHSTDRRALAGAGCATEAIGPLASAETRQTVARAESRPQALALLFMAPEFQRR